MDTVQKIGEYTICVSYDGMYYVYCEGWSDGKTITPHGLDSIAAALIFVGEHMQQELSCGLPKNYAEIEYDDFESAEAIEGAKFDDMNYLRYTER